MSTSQNPEAAAQNVPPAPPMPQAAPPMPQTAPPMAKAPKAQKPPKPPKSSDPRGLSLFLKISIVLLAALSIAAISLLFVGSFEGNFVRILATFVIFAVFVLLTALDTHLDKRSDWYAPVALIGNSYILAVVLIVTWMSPYEPFFLGWTIFWKALYVIVATRVVILCCQLLIGMGDRYPAALNIFAFITSILAVISGILFTAPVAIEVFEVTIPELYWRIAVAALMLTALGLAITLLLRWSYGSSDREAARRAREAQRAQYQQQLAYAAVGPAPQPTPQPQPLPVQQADPVQQPIPAPQPAQPQSAQSQSAQSEPAQSAPAQPVTRVPDEDGRLPWPTFADGRPLPIGPDGQPDFSVPGAPPRP